ncbi:MAG: hypothetical protein M1817_003157 [Caeruleum heppii]|nr:MAG: hypothetical protein M1817_003157 [Caeruleum heppii]
MKRGKGKGWCALDAEKLVDVLGHIPLAITQAAAFLSMFNMSLQQYLTTLKKDNANLRDFLSEELKCTDRESEYPNSIFLTWRASFNQIRREDPRAADLLACMAVLDRSGVFTNHLRRKTDTDLTYLKALGTLQAFDLIQASEYSGNRCPGWMPAIRIRVEEVKPPEKPIFVMHRLVRLSTQAWLESENTLSIYQMKVVHGIADKYRPPFRRLLPDESRYLGPHARTVSRYHAGSPPDRVARAKVRCILGITQILTPGSTRAFDNASRDAFKLNQRLLRADDPLAHRSFELSCERLCAFDEYEEVESMCRQNLRNLQAQGASDLKYELGVRAILARAISLQAGNSPFLLSDDHGNDHGFNSKADIAEATDKLDEAETMLQEVIRLQEQKLGITAALATRHWLMDHVLKC